MNINNLINISITNDMNKQNKLNKQHIDKCKDISKSKIKKTYGTNHIGNSSKHPIIFILWNDRIYFRIYHK